MDNQNDSQFNDPVQSSKNIWTIIILVIITALVASGGVYLWQKTLFFANQENLQLIIKNLENQLVQAKNTSEELQQQIVELQNQSSQFQQTESKPNKNLGEILYEDWLLYSNEEYGYEFNYPPEYKVVDTKGTSFEKNKSVNIIGPQNIPSEYQQGVFVSHLINILVKSLNSYERTITDNRWEEEEILFLDNKSAVLLKGFNQRGHRLFIIGSEEVYQIMVPYGPDFDDEFLKIFEMIYKSFKTM